MRATKRSSPRWLTILTGLLLVALTACGEGATGESPPGAETPGTAEDQVITILIAAPLTGDFAETGRDMVDGSQLAVDYINELGGVREGPMAGATLALEVLDMEHSTEAATTIASRVADDESIWVMTGTLDSAHALAAGLVLAREDVAFVAGFVADPSLTEEADNIVMIPTTLDSIGAASLDFVASDLGATRIGYVVLDIGAVDSLLSGFERQAEAIGVEIVSQQRATFEAADFSTILTSLERDSVDVVLLGVFQAQAGQIASQAANFGLDVPIVESWGEGWASTYIGTAGQAALGSYSYDVFAADPDPASFAGQIAQRFQEEYGRQMIAPAVHQFDAILTIHAALEAGASHRTEIIDYVSQATGQGLLGPIDYSTSLRPGERAATFREFVDIDPIQQRVAARYTIHRDGSVERQVN